MIFVNKKSASLLLATGVFVGLAFAEDDVKDVSEPNDRSRIQMISQTLSNQVPLVIAHRGASGYLPEHTTQAAAFAHALGADFIEQDVVMSQDSIAVVLHDVTLNATTNVAEVFPKRAVDGKFYAWDFTLAELKRLKVSERDRTNSSTRFPAKQGNFRIATLEEHIQLIVGMNASRQRQAGLYIEIKKPAMHRSHDLDPSREVLRLLTKYGYDSAEDRVFVQCFEAAELLRIRTELNCRLPLIQLFSGPVKEETLVATSKVADGIGVQISAVLKTSDDGKSSVSELVETAHRHSLLVHAWTLRTDALPEQFENTKTLLNKLVRGARVDGIFTDHPDAVLSWRRSALREGAIRGPFHLLQGRSVDK